MEVLSQLLRCAKCNAKMSTVDETITCKICKSRYFKDKGLWRSSLELVKDNEMWQDGHSYDKFYDNIFPADNHYKVAIDKIDRVLPNGLNGRLALDVGMGTGNFTGLLAEKFAYVVGVDSSLAFLRYYIEEKLTQGNVAVVFDDLESMQIEGLVDFAFLAAIFPNPDLCRRLQSWIAPKGLVCLVFDANCCSKDTLNNYLWDSYQSELKRLGEDITQYYVTSTHKKADYYCSHIFKSFKEAGFSYERYAVDGLEKRDFISLENQIKMMARNPNKVDEQSNEKAIAIVKEKARDIAGDSLAETGFTRVCQREFVLMCKR